MLKLSFLTLVVFLMTSFSLPGQTTSTIPLQVNKKHLNINYFPFDSIQVLDNRFDTTKIFITENGNYPPAYLNFSPSTPVAIKNYINSAVKDFPRGNKKLLINIEQFRIPNKTYFVQKKKNYSIIRNLRDYILFSAEIYYQTGDNRYRKIVTVNKNYYTYDPQMNEQFLIILNNIIEASCINTTDGSVLKTPKKLIYLLNDTASFNYSKDSTNISLEQINQNAKHKWSGYQIVKDHHYSNGFYSTFDDFRSNTVTADPVQVKYDEKHSLYIISLPGYYTNNKNFYPWAVCKSDTLYIQLYKDVYLKSDKLNNTFYFDVPDSLPDMYALLSIEAIKAESNAGGSTGNGVADLIAGAVSGTVDMIIKKSKENTIRKDGFKNNFRKCFIDMYCGDIIY
jgi:hypothetical protein